MREILIIGPIFLLYACATATPVNTGTDQKSYYIECSGGMNTMSSCIKKANSICPHGYNIAGAQEQQQGGGALVYNPNINSVSAIQNVSRNMAITCK